MLGIVLKGLSEGGLQVRSGNLSLGSNIWSLGTDQKGGIQLGHVCASAHVCYVCATLHTPLAACRDQEQISLLCSKLWQLSC